MSEDPKQRDVMRSLYQIHGENEDAVCAAYVKAELDGMVARKRDGNSTPPEAYAKALWKDGKAKGWISYRS